MNRVEKRLARELEIAREREDLPEPAERKRLREQAGLTQSQMARIVGCTRSAVSRYESGHRDAPRSAKQREAYRQALARLAVEQERAALGSPEVLT